MVFLGNQFSEDIYVAGEELLDKGAIIDKIKVNPKLWSIIVQDEEFFEIEVHKFNKKDQKTTCECTTFQETSECPHIVAALLFLYKAHQKKEQKKEKVKTHRSKSFTIQTVLKEVDIEDLKNYLKSYAQKDKNFNTMLKASFASKVKLEDNSEKYSALLSTLIRPISTQSKTSTLSEIRLAKKVLKEWYDQLMDLISLGELEEAFDLISIALPKLHYAYANYSQEKNSFRDLIHKYHSAIDEIYTAIPAPQLQNRLDDLIEDVFQRSYFNHLIDTDNLYFIAYQHDRSSLLTELKQYVDNQSIDNINTSSKSVFTAYKIFQSDFDLDVTEDEALLAVKFLSAHGYTEKATRYLEHQIERDKRSRKLEFALIDLYQKDEKDEELVQLASRLYVKYTDIKLYRMLKDLIPANQWKFTREKILKEMKDQESNPFFIARFLEMEELTDELIDVLNDAMDVHLTMKHDRYLYKKNYVALESHYKNMIENFLSSHGGPSAKNYVSMIMQHLDNSKFYKLSTALTDIIKSSFAHRGNFLPPA